MNELDDPWVIGQVGDILISFVNDVIRYWHDINMILTWDWLAMRKAPDKLYKAKSWPVEWVHNMWKILHVNLPTGPFVAFSDLSVWQVSWWSSCAALFFSWHLKLLRIFSTKKIHKKNMFPGWWHSTSTWVSWIVHKDSIWALKVDPHVVTK